MGLRHKKPLVHTDCHTGKGREALLIKRHAVPPLFERRLRRRSDISHLERSYGREPDCLTFDFKKFEFGPPARRGGSSGGTLPSFTSRRLSKNVHLVTIPRQRSSKINTILYAVVPSSIPGESAGCQGPNTEFLRYSPSPFRRRHSPISCFCHP